MKTLHLKREDASAQAAKKEDHHFDRKAKEISPQKVTRHVVAFANADGGTLVVGIADEKNEPNLCKRWDGFDSPEGANGFVENLLILTANNVREGDHSINISSDFPTGHQPLLRHIREGYFRRLQGPEAR